MDRGRPLLGGEATIIGIVLDDAFAPSPAIYEKDVRGRGQ